MTMSSRLDNAGAYLMTCNAAREEVTRPVIATRTHEVFGSDAPCCLAFRRLMTDTNARAVAHGGIFLHVVAEDYYLSRLGLTRQP